MFRFIPHLKFSPLLLLLVLFLASCEQSPTDGGPNGDNGTPLDLTEITDMPMMGGSIKDVSILPDGRIAAILDQKLVIYDAQMMNPQTIGDEPVHMALAAGKNGEIYTVTHTNILRTYDLAGGPVKNFPFTIQYNLTHAEIRITPQGDALAVITHGSSRGIALITSSKGESWTSITVPAVAQASFDVNVDHLGNFYFVSAFGLYRSSGHGAEWQLVQPTMPNFQDISLLITSSGRLYVYVRGARDLKYSDDLGVTFTDVPPNGEGPILLLKEGPSGSIYAIRSRGESLNLFPLPSALKQSTDGGMTWKHLVFCHSISFDAADNKVVIGTGDFWASSQPELLDGGYISTDAGATWETRGNATVSSINDIVVDKNGSLFMLAQSTLYERRGSRWITHGQQRGNFDLIGANSRGDMLISSSTGAYVKRTNTNWKVIAYQGVGGHLGSPVARSIAGRSNGEFLISIAYVRTGIESSGDIAAITSSDEAEGRTSLGYEMRNLYETKDGMLHATAYFPVGYQQMSELMTSNDGARSWQSVPSSNYKSITYLNGDYILEYKADSYYISNLTSGESKKIEFKNFNLTNERPLKYFLDANKKFYILSLDVLTSKLRILTTTIPL